MKKKVMKENLKYCQNQKTPFVDEMKGDQRFLILYLETVFYLFLKKTSTLQKLLSLYHP
jgi:hypothetical protein